MSDYEQIQRQKNADYRKAYAEWVSKLSPKQRRELEAQGLLDADVGSFETGKPKDVSELPLAANDGPIDSPEQELEDRQTWAALRRLIAELLGDNNPALALDCLALVSGIGFLGESMTEIARRHRVTRAAVSKRCVQWTKQLSLMPSRAMRSLTARQAYRNAQMRHRQNHEQFNSGKRTRSDQ